jgi:putative copper export protein
MADIRVEQKSGGRAWLWILLVLVLLIVAALLLDRAGYIDLPVNVGGAEDGVGSTGSAIMTVGVHLQEA